jgi:rod shape-determining protein MreD
MPATTVVVTVAACSFVGTSVFAFSGLVLGDSVATGTDLVRVTLVALLWDVLLTPLVLPGVMRVLARLEPAGAR